MVFVCSIQPKENAENVYIGKLSHPPYESAPIRIVRDLRNFQIPIKDAINLVHFNAKFKINFFFIHNLWRYTDVSHLGKNEKNYSI
jgi:hypothetical protein